MVEKIVKQEYHNTIDKLKYLNKKNHFHAKGKNQTKS